MPPWVPYRYGTHGGRCRNFRARPVVAEERTPAGPDHVHPSGAPGHGLEQVRAGVAWVPLAVKPKSVLPPAAMEPL
ncbi:hypothetical protein Sme01_38880 [Sphaerisporangium melleum]|uniref:Uncharacterized protein n=1 Tax=Sphaerisporangium melleum TaxID=321316 RepID=A0A917R2Z8_9ACTN|nr:hypothetical protein GCM10007964_30300 [Sphaerisporangium melleum]GII71412.1 hypothetical protein Sme01_38880 [Sphaerisporangium melleum]